MSAVVHFPRLLRSIGERMPALRRVMPAPPALIAEAIPFQGDLDEIVEELPSRMLRVPVYAVAGLLLALTVIAALVRVDIVVPASGQLATDSPPMMLQPMERAIIREVRVKPGDVVTKGQVLALLDPTFAAADLRSLESQSRLLASRKRRIEAELRDQPFHAAGPDDAEGALQEAVDRDSRAELASRLKSFDEQIEHDRIATAALRANLAILEQQSAVARNVSSIRSELFQAQVGSKLQFLDSVSNRLAAERAYNEAQHQIVELQHDLQSKQAQRQTVIDGWRRELTEALAKDSSDLGRLGDELSKARHMRELVTLTAPEDGVVLDIAQRSAGSMLQQAEPLVTILPTGVPLIADVNLSSSDIGYVHAGMEAVIKVNTFPYQRHGMLKGTLRAVGEESVGADGRNNTGHMAPGAGDAYHRAQLVLTSTRLEHLPEGARLLPGMTVGAEVKVGSRSVLSYFLYPVTRGLTESFREP